MRRPRACAECGAKLDEKRADATFCSAAHRQRAYRRRCAEREEAELNALARAAYRAVSKGELAPEEALELLICWPEQLRAAVRRQQLEAAA
jgi:hypothetical protein